MTLLGTVINGSIVLEGGAMLPEGTTVEVAVRPRQPPFPALVQFVATLSDLYPNPSAESRSEHSKGWGIIVRKLEDILTLEPDWDGGGARQPDPKIISFCIDAAHRFADLNAIPATCVSPTVEGGAVFQWQWDSVRMELECNEPNRAEWMLSVKGQKPRHGVIM